MFLAATTPPTHQWNLVFLNTSVPLSTGFLLHEPGMGGALVCECGVGGWGW